MTARFAVMLRWLLGEPLPEPPTLPPERCHQHKAPPPPSHDYRLRSLQNAQALAVARGYRGGWKGPKP
jgi:hypothetical protein